MDKIINPVPCIRLIPAASAEIGLELARVYVPHFVLIDINHARHELG